MIIASVASPYVQIRGVASGGAERMLLLLGDPLRSRGHKVDLHVRHSRHLPSTVSRHSVFGRSRVGLGVICWPSR